MISNPLRFTRSSLRRGLLLTVPVVALTATQALAAGGLVAATASADDGNVAANAIDANLSTRWSAEGRGVWLRADMGEVKSISAVDIAWHRGNERANTFTLATSTDGTTFTQVFSGKSSGTTASLERYTFPAVNARYVKVTFEGNTQNAWASVSEMAVTAGASTGGDTGGGTGSGGTGTVSATASTDDGNVAANAVDGNLSTRWSAEGRGVWLRTDMGQVKSVNAVDIAWHRGNERANTFTLATSTDGTAFTQVFSGKSSGTTASPERYTFPAVNARYVKMTFEGNTQNAWASVSEMAAGTGTSTPTPTPEPTPTPTPTPTPAGTDVFGVKMLYPSKAGGESWSLAADANKDSRFDPQNTITKNADGSWKIKSSQVRMSVFTSTGYSSSKIPTYDPDVLASRGYMQAANDWKNIEMTGFVKLNSASDSSDNFDWYARGGKHNDDLACEGTSYKAGLHYDGRARYQKESWHVSYEQADYKSATTALKGRWVGFKAVMRNTTVNSKPAVRLEMWLNNNADKVSWTKIYDFVDDGTWGGDTKHCGGGTDGMPFTWGGPIAVFRWDSASDVDFKWMSVREIQP